MQDCHTHKRGRRQAGMDMPHRKLVCKIIVTSTKVVIRVQSQQSLIQSQKHGASIGRLRLMVGLPLGLSGRGSDLTACACERRNSPTGSRNATTAIAHPSCEHRR